MTDHDINRHFRKMERDQAVLSLAEQGWSPLKISEVMEMPATLVESTVEHHRAGAMRAIEDLRKIGLINDDIQDGLSEGSTPDS